MSYLRRGGFILSLIVSCSSLGFTVSCSFPGLTASEEPAAEGLRMRPPQSLQCPRNNLTSFHGKVLLFRRNLDRTVIRLRTDENTTEEFTLHHLEGSDLTPWLLLRGAPFQPEDWVLIESAKNHLRPEMRAIVWVCDDGTNPVIDWRPSKTSQQPRPRRS
jgi:hypothetical protein